MDVEVVDADAAFLFPPPEVHAATRPGASGAGVDPLELLTGHDRHDPEPVRPLGGIKVGADMIELAVIPTGPIRFLQRQDRDPVRGSERFHVTAEPVPDLLDDRR